MLEWAFPRGNLSQLFRPVAMSTCIRAGKVVLPCNLSKIVVMPFNVHRRLELLWALLPLGG